MAALVVPVLPETRSADDLAAALEMAKETELFPICGLVAAELNRQPARAFALFATPLETWKR